MSTAQTRKVMLTRPAYKTHVVSQAKQQTPGKSTPPTPLPLKGGRVGGAIPLGNQTEDKIEALQRQAEGLSAADRRRLLDALALAELNAGTEADRDLVMWAQCVAEALEGVTSMSYGPLVVRKALATRPAWMPVQELIKATKAPDVQARQSVYGLLSRLLVGHADEVSKRSGAPLSAKLVANCAPNIAALFDQAFPGYLRNGLAPLVVRQLVSGAGRMQG